MSSRLWKAFLDRSPRENAAALRRKIEARLGRIHSIQSIVPMPNQDPALAVLATTRLPEDGRVIGLLGPSELTAPYRDALRQSGRTPVELLWTWDRSDGPERIVATPGLNAVIICEPPTTASQWDAFRTIRDNVSVPAIGAHELMLPFAPLQYAQQVLPYFEETDSLEKVAPIYMGLSFYGPLEQLNDVFSLAGRSIVELGPMDGAQTAGLVSLGAARVVAVEARPENYLKTLVAKTSFGWSNVELVSDDFHDVTPQKYGRFDLVFAHGVYYHSVAPFIFLENMTALADAVYVGGFCATDDLPPGSWQHLAYRGQRYAVKGYRESQADPTGGIHAIGYFFNPDALTQWFRDQRWRVEVLSDEPSSVTAGRYIRFLAQR
jgi:hypothetical protein